MSGSRESDPGLTVPNRVHYHYATPRVRRHMEACLHVGSERGVKAFAYTHVTQKITVLVLLNDWLATVKARKIYHFFYNNASTLSILSNNLTNLSSQSEVVTRHLISNTMSTK